MAWKTYFVSFECLSPLHIGFREIGNVVKTRYYIPGRVLWGALTAKLARTLFPNGASPKEYDEVGKYVKNHLRFGYFFPASDKKNDARSIFRPRFEREGEYYGTLSRDEFERRYLNSWASTAIGPSTFASEDGTLHETEILSPRAQIHGRPAKLYFNGFAYFQQNRPSALDDRAGANQIQKDDFILELAKELFLGGERRYGFGRVKLVQHQKLKDDAGVDPRPEDAGNEFLAAHLIRKSDPDKKSELDAKIRGPIEPFLGREWQSNASSSAASGAGQKFSPVTICWVPGSRILDNGKNLSFVVKPFGLWEAV